MKAILLFALSALARVDLATIKRIWSSVETMVHSFEFARFKDGSMSGAQKLEYVVERARTFVPDNRKDVATQIIRAVVELILIGLRLKGGTK